MSSLSDHRRTASAAQPDRLMPARPAVPGGSLERRVLIALLAVFVLGFCSLAIYLYDTRDELRRSLMFIQAEEIASGFSAASDPALLPSHYAGAELSYTLYSPTGEPLWHSGNLERPRRLRNTTMKDELRIFRRPVRSGLVINVPVRLPDGHVLMVAKNDQRERAQIGALLQTRLLRGLLILLPFCLLAAGLILWLLKWTLRPVRLAASLATDIGSDNPERRIPLNGLPREIQPLAHAANLGLERLAIAFAAEKRMVADAAHELRTPLTVLDLRLQKSRAEGVIDWPAVEQDMRHMRRMVHQMLTLAREEQSESKQRQFAARTHLSRITREAVALMMPLLEAQGRVIEAEIDDELHVRGEPDRLRDAIRNVIENALFHGQGRVSLWLRRADGDEALLDVRDQGPGVPPQAREAMFQRFRKGRQHSAGSGLGLAIVKQTLLNSGGDIGFVGTSPCVLRMRFAGVGAAPVARKA